MIMIIMMNNMMTSKNPTCLRQYSNDQKNYQLPALPTRATHQYGVNTYQTETTSQQIQQSVRKIISLNTSVKKRLKQMFDEQRRLNMIDGQTWFSADRVNRFFQDQKEINCNSNNNNLNQQQQDTTDNIDIFNEEIKSNFSTPNKKKNCLDLNDDDQEDGQFTQENINFLAKSIKKSFMALESGVQMVKSGFKKAISRIVRKTNKKNQNQQQKHNHKNLTFQSENLTYNLQPFKPETVDAEIMTQLIQQSIQINRHHLSSQKQQTHHVQTQTDSFLRLDVGIQLTTDDFINVDGLDQHKHFEEQVTQKLEKIINDKKEQNNKKKNKRGQHFKKKNPQVLQEQKYQQKQKQKTAFKNFSASKSFVYQYSVKKKAHISSASKSNRKMFVAKNTRAAKRNKQVQKSTISSLNQM